MPSSDTGFSLLPDVGRLRYNGATFSSLYKSELSGVAVLDEAARTVKYVQWTLSVEGYVTLNPGQTSTDPLMANLRKRLTQQGGALIYFGNGFGNLNVNSPPNSVRDVAWGPIPKLLHFQPLGAGRGAFVRWQVTTCIPEVQTPRAGPPLLQFNYEVAITFDDDGYAQFRTNGTIEIALTRSNVNSRTLSDQVDNYRDQFLDIAIDLTQYKVSRRNFNFDRSKRICTWEFMAEELPPMGIPAGQTQARGTMSVRPMRIGGGGGQIGVMNGVAWTCTLRATYTYRKDLMQRAAAWAFYCLWWYRMQCSLNGVVPAQAGAPAQQPPPPVNQFGRISLQFDGSQGIANGYQNLFRMQQALAKRPVDGQGLAVIQDFGFDEGGYLDSKTINFTASWFLGTTFSTLLAATGVWRWTPDVGGDAWATQMQGISGWRSYHTARLQEIDDVIVDFGGGTPNLSR